MIKIVIDEQTKREDISRIIEQYKEEHNIENAIVISPEEYKSGKQDGDIVIITKEEYDIESKIAETQELLYKGIKIPSIEILPEVSKTEIHQGRTERQKREQDKWRRKYFRKK